jgi:thermostable 8-oxoguanine DNA glycosylase
MELTWNIEQRDVETVKQFFSKWSNDPLVKTRNQRNVASPRPIISKERVWRVLVGCLLTTQQRSGPGSPVKRILDTEPFLLSYNECVNNGRHLEQFAETTLSRFNGIRRSPTISRQIACNLTKLEDSLWSILINDLRVMTSSDDSLMERKLAHFVADTFDGIGPKQSRNFLQWIGVTKFEIPIDSRITKWLNRNVLKFQLTANLLSDTVYYDMVSDGVQSLCERAGIYPCLLDAAIFTSFDGGWDQSDIGPSNF